MATTIKVKKDINGTEHEVEIEVEDFSDEQLIAECVERGIGRDLCEETHVSDLGADELHNLAVDRGWDGESEIMHPWQVNEFIEEMKRAVTHGQLSVTARMREYFSKVLNTDI